MKWLACLDAVLKHGDRECFVLRAERAGNRHCAAASQGMKKWACLRSSHSLGNWLCTKTGYRNSRGRCLCMPHQFGWLLLAFPLSPLLFWRGPVGMQACSNAEQHEKKMGVQKENRIQKIWRSPSLQAVRYLIAAAGRAGRRDPAAQLQAQPSCEADPLVPPRGGRGKAATLGGALQRPSAGRECHLVPPAVTCLLHTARHVCQ